MVAGVVVVVVVGGSDELEGREDVVGVVGSGDGGGAKVRINSATRLIAYKSIPGVVKRARACCM